MIDTLCDAFGRFAKGASSAAGSPFAFLLGLLAVVIWALTGPLFGFGDTWQLVINTSTTIVTFLMVFLIQNSQNRDSRAVQVKLDELIRAVKGARNAIIDLEDLPEKELALEHKRYAKLAERARMLAEQAGLTNAADDSREDAP